MTTLLAAAKRLLMTHGCINCVACTEARAAIVAKDVNVDATEAMGILVVSRTTIQDLIARGKLTPVPSPDGKLYFNRLAVEELHIDRALHPSRRGGRRPKVTA
jgi:hypothetical protein